MFNGHFLLCFNEKFLNEEQGLNPEEDKNFLSKNPSKEELNFHAFKENLLLSPFIFEYQTKNTKELTKNVLLYIFRSIIRIKVIFIRFRKRFIYKNFSRLKRINFFDNQKRKEIKLENKIIKKYEDLYKKPVKNNSLILVEVLSIKSILFEFSNYTDNYPFLLIRKNFLLLTRLISYLSYQIVSSSYFMKTIFFFIFIDSLIIIFNLPQNETQTFEFVVANIYLLEMVLKMIAFGLILGKNSYFRNKWNFLDFGVVVSIYFYRFFNVFVDGDFTILRNVIVLRLIKLPPFQLILDKLFFAFVLLFDTFMIIMIFLFICSLVGVQLFLGLLKYKCMSLTTGLFDNNSYTCGVRECSLNYMCIKGLNNPDSGVTNYDNIFFGVIQTLRLITLDNWTDLQYLLQNAFSEQVWIYVIIIVALGNFFMINLMLSVLKVKYSECNPDTLNEIKAYFDKYKEKSYILQELKSQGFYKKNKKTGIRSFGGMKKSRFLSLFSAKKHMTNDKKKSQASFMKKSQLLKLLDPQVFLKLAKKTLGFLTKNKMEALFTKTRMITMKEGAADLGDKTIEIRIDRTVIYESDSINDVLPLKKKEDFEKTFEKNLNLRKLIKIPIIYNFEMISDETKVLKMMAAKKKTRLFNKNIKLKKGHKRNLALKLSKTRFSAQKMNSTWKKNTKKAKQKKIQRINRRTMTKKESTIVTEKPKNIENKESNAHRDYEQMSDLINEKIKSIKLDKNDNERQGEIEFLEILKEDIINKKIITENWSSDDILKPNHLSFKRLSQIQDALNQRDIQIWIIGFQGIVVLIRKFALMLSTHRIFIIFLSILEFLNTIFLSIEGMIDNSLWINLNLVVRSFFIAEFIIKLTAVGFKKYLKKFMNIIDMFSVYYSVLELIGDHSSNFFSDINGINFLRYFRFLRILLVLRILKLCIKLDYMNFIIHVLQKSLYNFIVIIGMFFLVVSFYALIGRSVLSSLYAKSSSHLYFNTFGNSFMTTFMIITMDNWYNILTEGVKDSTSLIKISCFVVSIIFLGNFIFLNLFLTVLLDAFENENQRLKLEVEKKSEGEEIDQNNDNSLKLQNFRRIDLGENSLTKERSEINFSDMKEINSFFESSLFQEFNTDRSLLIFAPKDFIRVCATKMSKHQFFYKVCQFFIIFQIILTIVGSFGNENEVSFIFLNGFVYGFFSIEAILKIISKGLLFEDDTYLRSYSNCLNFCAVMGFYSKIVYHKSSLLCMIFSILQAIIPLRILETNKKLNKIAMSFWQSLEEMVNVVVALLLVWFIISIWGVNLFRSRFGFCDQPDNFGKGEEECSGQWMIFRSNFENVYNALLTLLEISTFDSWSNILNIAVNSDISTNGPTQDNNIYSAFFFFLCFIFIGNWLMLNLLLGVIFTNFSLAEQSQRYIDLNQNQIEWITIQNKILNAEPLSYIPPKTGFRFKILNFIKDKKYKKMLLFTLSLNIIALGLYHEGASFVFTKAITIITYYVTIFYTAEFIMKMFCYGFLGYFYTKSFLFEFIILIGYFSEFSMKILENELSSNSFFTELKIIIKCVKLLSIIRFFGCLKALKSIIRNLGFSIRMLGNFLYLILIVFFIYSTIGNYLFSDVTKGSIIDDRINFNNVISGMMTLFKCITCDNWVDIMYDIINDDCEYCGTASGIIFFLSFMILSYFLLFNVFSMVLLKEFENFYINPLNPRQVYEKILQNFKISWAFFSSSKVFEKTFLHKSKLFEFLKFLGPPLGIKRNDPFILAAKKIMGMTIQHNDEGNCYFNEILFYSLKSYFLEKGFFEDLSNEALSCLEGYEKKFLKKLKMKKNEERKSLKNAFISKATSIIQNFKKSHKNTKSRENLTMINPIYDYLISSMAFKTWTKYASLVVKYEVQEIKSPKRRLSFDELLISVDEDELDFGKILQK